MKKIILYASAFMFATSSAYAADSTSSGSGALALAALVGNHSPDIKVHEKAVLADLLNGNLSFTYPEKEKIEVAADSVSCAAGNVDISFHECTLKFGKVSHTLKGREAHELYATLVENGVPSDGAAGTIYEAVSHLTCAVEPAAVKQKDGSGAKCTWQPGP